MSKQKKPSDYVVGYGHPPKATQFKAGRSGNPKGRPKGRRPIGAVLQDIFQQKVPVAENGKTCRRTILEMTLRGLAEDAMRGDVRAIKLSFLLLGQYADSPQAAVGLRELLDEDAEILAKYLRKAEPPDSQGTSVQNEDSNEI
jgi:hypothetical protein